jgi:uncharacterized protein YfeS
MVLLKRFVLHRKSGLALSLVISFMLSEDAALVKGYEVLGMTPAEIGKDRDLDEFAVKAKLLQLSAKYRKDARNEPEAEDELNFSNDQLRTVNQVIYETALSATTIDGQVDYRTRLAAATYIRDDKKGRKEVNKTVGGANFNVLQLNQTIIEARKLREERVKTLPSPKQTQVIEV